MSKKTELSTDHERAPETSKDVTPPLKGGKLEKTAEEQKSEK